MRVFISAGEASGDLYGAAIASRLLMHGATITGLGGVRMAALGIPLLGDSSRWGSISIVQSVREGLRGIGTYYRLRDALRAGPPGVFVPIDFGYMNLRLCREAKAASWKVLYFIPPGSWRRDRQGRDIPSLTDEVVTNFPWSAEILNGMGATAFFLGHPLLEINSELGNESTERSGLALLPGSRRSELEQLLPVMSQTFASFEGTIRIPVPNRQLDYVRKQWQRPQDVIVDGSVDGAVYRTLRMSERAVVCSGTATLEAALAETPMVVVYKVSRLVELETKMIGFKLPEFISQPNILLQRKVVPELVQHQLSPESLVSTLSGIDAPAQLKAFQEIRDLLSPNDCITQTVEHIRSLHNYV